MNATLFEGEPATIDCVWCHRRHGRMYLCDEARHVLSSAVGVANMLTETRQRVLDFERHLQADHDALARVWQLADAYANDPTIPVDSVAVAVTATLRDVAKHIREAVTG